MLVRSLIVLITRFTAALSSPITARDGQVTFDTLPASRNLTWSPCYDEFECAKLDLPMDPDDPSDNLRVSIPLLKYPANVTGVGLGDYAGMMLFNPGGPGSAGTTFLPFAAPVLANLLGPNWDIVTFDPRGVGFAYPSSNCSNLSITGTSQPTLSKRAEGLTAPHELEQYFHQELEMAYTIGQQCNASIGANSSSIGHYVSTYYVARDILAIVDAYSKSPVAANVIDADLVNFYGLSYGTIIGQVLASEFPEKLRRFILDGVLDPYDYVSGKTLNSIYLDDEIVEQFLRLCQLAGPRQCAFAQDTDTPLFPRFQAMINKLDPKVAAANGWQNTTDIATALALITSPISGLSFYPIESFPSFGSLLAAVEPIILRNFSLAAIKSALSSAKASSPITQTEPSMTARTEWEISIMCSDADWVYGQNDSTAISNGDLENLRNQSSIQADGSFATHYLQCAGWPISAQKRSTGPFGSSMYDCECKRGNPCEGIQFIGITLDYATPLVNAVSNSKRFEGSGVIAIDSIGHTGITSMSQCALKAVQQYLATGQPLSTFCPLETVPFNVTGLSEYGWISGGQLVSNQTRVYVNSNGEGPLISDIFNQTG